MALVMSGVAPVKAEIRLQQALQRFLDDLKPEQRDGFLNDRAGFHARQPDENDVAAFVGTLNRQTPRSHRYGPRFFNILQVAQQFAAIGDIVVGSSQSSMACGVWSAVRTTLMLVIKSSNNVEKLSHMFMVAGQSAPRYEAICRLYHRKSSRLWSYYYEYFIVLVDVCHRFIKAASRSPISRVCLAVDDCSINTSESMLAHWASMIREETALLTAQSVEEQGSILTSLLDISSSRVRRNQGTVNARVLAACSTYDYQANWKRHRKMGTTALFLEASEYVSWKGSSAADGPRTLLYTGKLGCGKSVLMANVVEDLSIHAADSKIPVAYFFCQYDEDRSLNAHIILGCLARQLLQSTADLSQAAEFLGDRLELTETNDIVELLRLCLPAGQQLFCVVDGLDECGAREQRLVLKSLRKLQNSHALRVCFSFRLEADNALRLDQSNFVNCTTATFPDENPEIEQFICDELERCIETDLLAVGDPTLIVEIVNTLTKHAHGMFLWVSLQITSLCASKTDMEIRQSLPDMPKDLAETFARNLDKCAPSSKPYQRRIFELVLSALRGLTVEELREALGVLPGDTNWDPTRLPNNIYSVPASCGALLTIDEETLQIRMVHKSARDFLLGNFSENTDEPRISLGRANLNMASTVLTYLNYGIFDTQLAKAVAPSSAAGSAPLAVVQSTSSSKIVKSLALKILRSSKMPAPDLDLARMLDDVRRRATTSAEGHAHRFHSYATKYWARHVCCITGDASEVHSMLLRLLKRRSVEVDGTSSNGRTLLSWAEANGDEAVIGMLVEAGVDLEDEDKHGQTALSRAAKGGKDAIAKLLVAAGADLDTKGKRRETPLLLAVGNGHRKIVELLIEKGADLDSRDRDGSTPLGKAIYVGHLSIAELLIEKGASMLIKNGLGQTPLSEAVACGHLSIAKLLIEKGADVESPDGFGYTPLSRVIHEGYQDIAKLLIQNRADVDRTDGFGWTPLTRALYEGHDDIAVLLIKYGADIEREDMKGYTPKRLAMGKGEAIYMLLIEKAADDM